MRNRKWTTMIAVAMVGAVALTGCTAGNKAPADNAPAASTKPALEIPKEFASEDAKRDFAVKAMATDHYEEAEALLEDVTQKAQNDASAFAFLGTAKYMLNHFDEAIAAWNKAAEVQPNLAGEMQNNIGNAQRDLNKLEEAKAAYRKALELDPNRSSAAINLADILKSEGNRNEAINVLETALAHSPKESMLVSLTESYKAETTKSN